MVIAYTSGDVTIGGSPQHHGQLRVKDAWGGSMGFIGKVGEEVRLTLGALSSSGLVRTTDVGGRTTAELDGQSAELTLGAPDGDNGGDLSVLNSRGIRTTQLSAGHLHLYEEGGAIGADLHVDPGLAHLHLFGPDDGPRVDVLGEEARVQLFDANGDKRADLDGTVGSLELLNSEGDSVITCDAETNSLQLLDRQGKRKIELLGTVGSLRFFDNVGGVIATLGGNSDLTLGGGMVANTNHGSITLLNADGVPKVICEASSGSVQCDVLTENSDLRLKVEVEPLSNALDDILALQGIRYRNKQAAGLPDSVPAQIGFVGQELEAVCPELVTTDADGYKSVSYSRVTALLVEAIKEQQRQLRDQAAALEEMIERVASIEEAVAAQPGPQ